MHPKSTNGYSTSALPQCTCRPTVVVFCEGEVDESDEVIMSQVHRCQNDAEEAFPARSSFLKCLWTLQKIALYRGTAGAGGNCGPLPPRSHNGQPCSPAPVGGGGGGSSEAPLLGHRGAAAS